LLFAAQMVCSICKGSGHNKRTCIAQQIDETGVPDHAKEQVINHLTNHVSDEALAEAIEFGLDIIIPGAGLTMKLGRYGWRYFHSS
jgi:hypothetical protein